MKRAFIYIVTACCVLFALHSFSQTQKADSLRVLIRTGKADTNKLNCLVKLAREFDNQGYYDSAMVYARLAVKETNQQLADPANSKFLKTIRKIEGNAYNALGIAYDDKGDYPNALKNYFISLKIRTEIGDLRGQGASHNNIGLIYEHQGNYPDALKSHFNSLKIDELLGYRDGIADSYTNIGNVYADQGNFPDALANHLSSLKIREEIGDKHGMGVSYNNIGLVYYYMFNYEQALRYHFAALDLRTALGEQRGKAITNNNIGLVYYDQAYKEGNVSRRNENLQLALKHYFMALKEQKEMGETATLGNLYNNIANVYIQQKKFDDAESYLLKAKLILTRIGYREYLRGTYRALIHLDSARGNYKGAYENFKQFILYRDSLDNEDTRKKTVQSQMTYEFEKKEAIAKAEYKKELESQGMLAEEKSRKQRVILILVSVFLIFVLAFAGFIFRSLKLTRKQKSIIEEQKRKVEEQKLEVEMQKAMVEEHQKAIIDSITYARRIQQSLLPTEMYIEKNIKRLKKQI